MVKYKKRHRPLGKKGDFMNNEDFRNEQKEFDENAFYASSAPSPEDISGVVENLSQPRSMLYSIVSLACGIVSVVIGCCGGWFGLGIGALALVFSIVARRHLGYFDGKAIAGLVLGICGFVLSAVSQVGDLIASLIKRERGVKDYGNIFPGHGGVMDRFDSVLSITTILMAVCIVFPPFT